MAFIGPDVVLNKLAYVHDTAHLYGKVMVGESASIWVNVVARAEHKQIVIGPYTNIQDFVMLHVGDRTDTIIGSHCSITHHCTMHGCTIGDNCLIGIHSTIADGCVVGDNCIIGAHTYLKEGTIVPANSVVVGAPGKVIRTQNNFVRNRLNAYAYFRNALAYATGDFRAWGNSAFPAEMMAEMQRLSALLPDGSSSQAV
ncbi:MAG TPA: gamma carbonic anhydrase family protein [Noviherbaspirillum sp.]|nr:gamma carbonic anhydrase family protein [Noviherbaspirillum sp.]